MGLSAYWTYLDNCSAVFAQDRLRSLVCDMVFFNYVESPDAICMYGRVWHEGWDNLFLYLFLSIWIRKTCLRSGISCVCNLSLSLRTSSVCLFSCLCLNQSLALVEQFHPWRVDGDSEDYCIPLPLAATLLSEEAVAEWSQTVMFWEAAAAFGIVNWEGGVYNHRNGL